jgi:NAD(P)-dependent dehydrogenase (short-subunit alcohol dehydrogenase family)
LSSPISTLNAAEDLKVTTLTHFGRVDVVMNNVDVVMNNVGVLTHGLPDRLPVSEWERIINVNLFSAVRSNAAFLPLLLNQAHGRIVNTASFAGFNRWF